MGLHHFDIDELVYTQFKATAGARNMTKIIEDFMRAYSGIKEEAACDIILDKEYALLTEEKDKVTAKWQVLKSKVDARDQKRKLEEIDRLKREKEIYDTIKMNEYRANQEKLRRRPL